MSCHPVSQQEGKEDGRERRREGRREGGKEREGGRERERGSEREEREIKFFNLLHKTVINFCRSLLLFYYGGDDEIELPTVS